MKAFAGLHPAVLLFYFLSLLAVTMFSDNPILSATALLGGILCCAVLQGREAMRGNLGFCIPLFLLVSLTNPLFSHAGATTLFRIGNSPVTLEALLYGIALAVTVVGVMLWCNCYSHVMTSDKFLFLFGGWVPRLALVLSAALRFVPMLKRRARAVRDAQRGMGMDVRRGLAGRVRNTCRVYLAVISWSLEHAMETAAAMKARGYGSGRRTHFSLFRLTGRDGAFLALCVLLAGGTVLGMASGATAFAYYPKTDVPSLSPGAVAVYLAFFVLSVCPFIMEMRENVLWKSCRSKI